MPTSPAIQSTKLAPPRVPRRAVRRARLLARIDAAPEAALVVVTGAPGAGKTALLAEWAESCPDPVAWCTLDVNDNDPAVFWEAVDAAVATAVGDDRPHDAPPEHLGAGGAVDRILSAVTSDPGDRRLWLVLDDLHEVDDRAVLDGITRLIRHLPPTMRVVIASRADPAVGVAALRAQARVVEIADADLHFTASEAAEALADNGVVLDDSAVDTLVDRTRGWAAGIQLAASVMAGMERPEAFVASIHGSERTIADYLREECLDRQPAELRSFLLDVSVLDELHAPLCDALRCRTDSAALLREIERRHLFVDRVDDEQGTAWFRLHDLFRRVLLDELTTLDPQAPTRLRRRAGEWLAAHDQPVAAIRQLLAAEAWEAAGAVILQVETTLLLRGWAETLAGWYAQLPASVQPDALRLLRLFWSAAFTDNIERAKLVLAQLQTATTADPTLHLDTEILMAEGFLAFRRGDMHETIERCDRAAAGYVAAGEGEVAALVFATVLAADARMHLGEASTAEEALRDLLAQGWLTPETRTETTAALAAAVARQGRFVEAIALAAEALGGIDPAAVGPRTLPEAWLAAAAAHLARGRYDLVDRDLERVHRDAAGFRAGPVFASIADELTAHVKWLTGDVEGAFAALDATRARAVDQGIGHEVLARIDDRRAVWEEVVRERSGVPELTVREREVLSALASYRSLQEIAGDLFVSMNTLKSHLKSVYSKLGVSSRNEAVRRGTELSLISDV